MKKLLIIFVLMILLICIDTYAFADVEINENNFPDVIFRDYIMYFDKNNDLILSDEEISEITSLNLKSMGISSLDGIEFFTSLSELECGRNNLSSLDISNNTELTNLSYHNNCLSSLNVSKCPITIVLMLGGETASANCRWNERKTGKNSGVFMNH